MVRAKGVRAAWRLETPGGEYSHRTSHADWQTGQRACLQHGDPGVHRLAPIRCDSQSPKDNNLCSNTAAVQAHTWHLNPCRRMHKYSPTQPTGRRLAHLYRDVAQLLRRGALPLARRANGLLRLCVADAKVQGVNACCRLHLDHCPAGQGLPPHPFAPRIHRIVRRRFWEACCVHPHGDGVPALLAGPCLG